MEELECSATATDHIYAVQEMLNDIRLMLWCQATDTNFLGAPETQLLLVEARKAFDKLVEVMEHAE